MIVETGTPEGAGLFIPPLYEIILSALCLGVIALVIVKVAVPAFLRTLDERTAKIEGGIRRAEEAEEAIAAERAQWRAELEQARAEAGLARDQARADAAAIVAEAQVKARAEADRILAAAAAQIAAETKAAETELRGQIGGLATVLAGEIVGEAMADEALAGRVIDRFLDDLAANTAPAGVGR